VGRGHAEKGETGAVRPGLEVLERRFQVGTGGHGDMRVGRRAEGPAPKRVFERA